MTSSARRKLIAALIAALAALGVIVTIQPSPGPSPIPTASIVVTASPSPRATTVVTACLPTDQDQYVYSPNRLVVVLPCLRVTGMVALVRNEPDGDLHILLTLDPPYRQYVNAVNVAQQKGDLVVEPVCVNKPTQASAIAVCAADTTPLTMLPTLGQHVWMEGRYVTDSQHGGWAELHPLYRWGVAP